MGSFEGLWVDFSITVLIYFYLNTFNFWLVATPHKVVVSQKTQELVESYMQEVLKDDEKSWETVYRELKNDAWFNKFLTRLTE